MRHTRPLIAVILFFLAAGIMANTSGHFTTTAEQVLKQLRRPNAADYASRLYDDEEKWGFVTDQIATGQPDWLQVAALLEQYADGAFSEELDTDLALALVKRPADVLRLLQEQSGPKRFRRDGICHAPIPTPGKDWLKQYKARAIKAVENVRDVELREGRDACLRALRSIDLSRPADAYE